MLPERYRMTRSTEFGATVKRGVRATQPDIVVYALKSPVRGDEPGPRVGLVVAKSVGNAVQRHRVARRLRAVARAVVGELSPADRVVIRALPSSSSAISARLDQQLRAGLVRCRLLNGRPGVG